MRCEFLSFSFFKNNAFFSYYKSSIYINIYTDKNKLKIIHNLIL